MGLITVLIVTGLGEAKNLLVDKKFTIKPVIGGFILGIFLFALESLNEELADRLDTLIIIAALLLNGGAVADTIAKGK